MNAKEFNKYKTVLYNKYGAVKNEPIYEVKVLTSFGTLYISAEWSPKIKVANIHSRFEGDINKFIEVTGFGLNKYNNKYNFYFNNPLDCLDELEKYLIKISGAKKNDKSN